MAVDKRAMFFSAKLVGAELACASLACADLAEWQSLGELRLIERRPRGR